MLRAFNKKLRWARIARELVTVSIPRRRFLRGAEVLVLAIVGGAYAVWGALLAGGLRAGAAAMLVSTVAPLFLYAIAFSLGVRYLMGETAAGTAESLVLTPAPKGGIISHRIGFIMKIVALGALLLPVYCVTGGFERSWVEYDDYSATAFVQGWLARANVAVRYMADPRPASISPFLGVLALAADLCWCAVFAACGMLGAVWSRGRRVGWLTGLLLAATVFVVLGAADDLMLNVMLDPVPVPPPPLPSRTWGWWTYCGSGAGMSDSFLVFFRVAPSVILRLVAARACVGLAARHFDRLATD